MATEKELRDKIAKLKSMGEDDLVAKYEKELATLSSGNAPAKASAGDMVIPVTEEEFEKTTSKFAQVGLHISEFGMPYWKTAGVSIAFPFTITEEGADKGKENEIAAGVKKEAVWKLREILMALGVSSKKTANGQVAFNPMDVVGKIGKTQWIEQKDTRSVEEGGKGSTYTKPVSVLPLSASAPEDLV